MLTGSKTLLLRADASPSIGTGHVMRSMALAEEWIRSGGRAVFAGLCESSAMIGRMQNIGIDCDLIGQNDSTSSVKERCRSYIAALNAEKAMFRPWVLLDGYQFGSEDQSWASRAGARVICIDDFCHAGHYSADIVVNQNAYAKADQYADKECDTTILAGSRYVVLRKEFIELDRTGRSFSKKAGNLLITFGGSDPKKETLKVLDGLATIASSAMHVRVLIGSANTAESAIRQKAQDLPRRVEVLKDVKDMAQQLMWADMAVASAGTTSWEMAYCGVPTIMITIADNQLKVADSMKLNGAGLNLGPSETVSSEMIGGAVVRLLENPEHRKEMSLNGMRLVDGEGRKRIVAQMTRKQLKLRNAAPEDKQWIWHLANDPVVRSSSFNSDEIKWEEHEQWYAARMADKKTVFLVVESDLGQKLGYVRFMVDGVSAVVSVALQQSARGLGIGGAVIELATRQLVESTGVKRVEALIKTDNKASVRAFAVTGYTRHEDCLVNGHDAVRMVFSPEVK